MTAAETGAQTTGALTEWLVAALGDAGPFTTRRLAGGNSNETLLVSSPRQNCVLRRPPAVFIATTAHSMEREFRILEALEKCGVRAPRPLALCTDRSVAPNPFLVMEMVDGHSITDTMPAGSGDDTATITRIGEVVIDELVSLHECDWRNIGLDDLGRPEGYLERQVPRWSAHYRTVNGRDLPDFYRVASWLESHRPAAAAPALIHSDFHLDNCLVTIRPAVSVAAIIDWEMATIGDPMLDVGLFLALWGPDRPSPAGLGFLQGATRGQGVVSREDLAQRYAAGSGRDVNELAYYMVLALWKLGAIIEGSYQNHVAGRIDTEYSRNLRLDVPRLFAEAAELARIGTRSS